MKVYNQVKKEEFVKKLSGASFIYAVKNDSTEESCLLKASQTYFSDDDLKNYFDGYQSVYFVSGELYEKFGEEKVREFLKDLGVEDKPRRIEIKANLSWEEKSKLRGNNWTREMYQKDYEYEGLENFINNITPEKSYLLWKLFLKSIESLSSWQAQKFFEGEYSWFYYSQQHATFEAKFLKTLRQQTWLVDKNDTFKKPSEITFSELLDYYIKENPNIDILIKALGFKPDIFDQLPLEAQERLKVTEGISPDELKRIADDYRKKSGAKDKKEEDNIEKGWEPNYPPDEVDAKIEEAVPTRIKPSDLKEQTEKLEPVEGKEKANGSDSQAQKKEGGEVTESLSTTDKKNIGAWGEEFVFNALKKEYLQISDKITATDFGFKLHDPNGNEIEVVWLNTKGNVGKGYDIVRKENGIEVEYMEVKTKLGSHEELIEITGTQWEFARMLYNRSEGNKYSIYVVSNAGQSSAKIIKLNNPIALWKEGRLYAHPVNFRL